MKKKTLLLLGFISTAIIIALLAVISVALSNNGLIAIGERVHPHFGLIFAIVVYLSIGAFYGIPQCGLWARLHPSIQTR